MSGNGLFARAWRWFLDERSGCRHGGRNTIRSHGRDSELNEDDRSALMQVVAWLRAPLSAVGVLSSAVRDFLACKPGEEHLLYAMLDFLRSKPSLASHTTENS